MSVQRCVDGANEGSQTGRETDSVDLPLRQARVLVVEDERHIARLLDFVLRKAGYAVSLVHTAEEALQAVGQQAPDAVLLDVVLPGKTGIELLRIIRGSPFYCPCIVIILSSNWFEQTDAVLADAGANAQLSKPIAPSTLLRKLEELGVHPLTPSGRSLV